MGESSKRSPTSKPLSECTPSNMFSACQTICLCSLCVPLMGFILAPTLALTSDIKLWWVVALVYGFCVIWCSVHIFLSLVLFMFCSVTPLRNHTLGQLYVLLKRAFKIYVVGLDEEELDEEANVIVDPDEMSQEEIERIKRKDFGEESSGESDEMKENREPDEQSIDKDEEKGGTD